jgi:hypothetical protein
VYNEESMDGVRRRSLPGRIWGVGLVWHVAALAVLLLVVALIVRPTASFSSDEGAVLGQTRLLADGQGWLVKNPLASMDPTGDHFAFKLSDGGPVEFAPYARHPAHPLALVPVLDHLGVAGVVWLSIAGTLLAALAAARLAGLVDRRYARPTFWVAGLGSQLFFDAQVVMAHAPAAAFDGWGTVLLLEALPWVRTQRAARRVGAVDERLAPVAAGPAPTGDRSGEDGDGADGRTVVGGPVGGGPGSGGAGPGDVDPLEAGSGSIDRGGSAPTRARAALVGRVVGAIVLFGAAQALRSEAVLYALAFAVVIVVQSLRRRVRSAAVIGGAVGIVAVALVVAERAWYSRIMGAGASAPANGASGPLVTKAAAALWSLVGPGRGDPGAMMFLATGVMVLSAAAAFLIRKRPPDWSAATVFLAIAAVIGFGGLFVAEPEPITGVLPAFPALVVALVLFRRSLLESPVVATLVGVVALFAIAVLATSYEVGGGAEWGGRYFAVGFPALSVLVVVSIGRALPWSEPAARRCLGALAAVSLSLALLGVQTLRWSHELDDARTAAIGAMVVAAGPTSGPDLGDGDRRPIVVQTDVDAGRFAWDDFQRTRGIQVSDENVSGFLDRLAAAGAASAVIQSDDLGRAADDVRTAGWRVVQQADGVAGHGGAILVERP